MTLKPGTAKLIGQSVKKFVSPPPLPPKKALSPASNVPAGKAPSPKTTTPSMVPSAPSPATVQLHKRIGRRYPWLRQSMEVLLRRERLPVPEELTDRLADIIDGEVRRSGRRINELSQEEVGKLVESARAHLLRASPSVQALARDSRATLAPLKLATGAPVDIAVVPMSDGYWLFFHANHEGRPIVAGEAFIPRDGVPAASPLLRPPAPGGADARWINEGKLAAGPPSAIASPPVPLGWTREIVERVPELLVDHMRRGDLRRTGNVVPIGDAVTRFAGVAPRFRQTLGLGGIESIERFPVPLPGPGGARAADFKVRISGSVGQSLGGVRFGDENILPLPGTLGLEGYERLHLWGPGFGDSAIEGIAYGPKELNAFQNRTIEGFLRGRRNGRTRLEVDGYFSYGQAAGTRVPFVESVTYRFTLEDGKVARFEFQMEGGVATSGGPFWSDN